MIEDWEVWGDPREVERRRAERKRASLPRETRLQLIAEELAQVRFQPGGRLVEGRPLLVATLLPGRGHASL